MSSSGSEGAPREPFVSSMDGLAPPSSAENRAAATVANEPPTPTVSTPLTHTYHARDSSRLAPTASPPNTVSQRTTVNCLLTPAAAEDPDTSSRGRKRKRTADKVLGSFSEFSQDDFVRGFAAEDAFDPSPAVGDGMASPPYSPRAPAAAATASASCAPRNAAASPSARTTAPRVAPPRRPRTGGVSGRSSGRNSGQASVSSRNVSSRIDPRNIRPPPTPPSPTAPPPTTQCPVHQCGVTVQECLLAEHLKREHVNPDGTPQYDGATVSAYRHIVSVCSGCQHAISNSSMRDHKNSCRRGDHCSMLSESEESEGEAAGRPGSTARRQPDATAGLQQGAASAGTPGATTGARQPSPAQLRAGPRP